MWKCSISAWLTNVEMFYFCRVNKMCKCSISAGLMNMKMFYFCSVNEYGNVLFLQC